MWYCYKSKKDEKANCRRSLEDKLKDLLEPSTDKYALDSMRDANLSVLPAHLRLKQKELDQKEWFVDSAEGVIHNGAHFPLCLFTKNSSHRSANAHARRQWLWPYEWQWWAWQHAAKVKANKDKTAVAEQEAWTAVVEGPSSPAWMERTIAASSWETAFEANDSWCTTPASSWLPTRDGPNCDGNLEMRAEHWVAIRPAWVRFELEQVQVAWTLCHGTLQELEAMNVAATRWV